MPSHAFPSHARTGRPSWRCVPCSIRPNPAGPHQAMPRKQHHRPNQMLPGQAKAGQGSPSQSAAGLA
eukprot:7498798-Alexandrium_andersonii.AAC.1